MDQWQALVVTAIVGALAYLFNSDKNKARALASIETSLKEIMENQIEMKHQIAEDKKDMRESQNEIRIQQKAIDDKLNIFLANEITELKKIASEAFRQKRD